jgi:hypothetical protein
MSILDIARRFVSFQRSITHARSPARKIGHRNAKNSAKLIFLSSSSASLLLHVMILINGDYRVCDFACHFHSSLSGLTSSDSSVRQQFKTKAASAVSVIKLKECSSLINSR